MAYNTLERLYKDGKISFDELVKIIREFSEEKLSEAIEKLLEDKNDKQGINIDDIMPTFPQEIKKKTFEPFITVSYGCPYPNDEITWTQDNAYANFVMPYDKFCNKDNTNEENNLIDSILLEKVKNKPEEWRVGQALFNYAEEIYPKETDMIRGTDKDCFYDDTKCQVFLKELNKLVMEL